MKPMPFSYSYKGSFWLDLSMHAHIEKRGDKLHVFGAYQCSPAVMAVDLCVKNEGLPQMLGAPRMLGDAKDLQEAELLIRADMKRIDAEEPAPASNEIRGFEHPGFERV